MKGLRALLAVAYPFLVFGGLRVAEPRTVALALGALVALRGLARARRPAPAELRRLAVPVLAVAAVLGATAATNDARVLLFVPALTNGALLFAFARTLWGGPSLVESFARLQVPDLPADEVRYCRGVTALWCGFFAANGAVSLALALHGNLTWWTLYTGLVAYLLVGALFAAEFVVRSARFGRYEGTLVEPLFRRLFPQGRTP